MDENIHLPILGSNPSEKIDFDWMISGLHPRPLPRPLSPLPLDLV